jgi:hypothetical protein
MAKVTVTAKQADIDKNNVFFKTIDTREIMLDEISVEAIKETNIRQFGKMEAKEEEEYRKQIAALAERIKNEGQLVKIKVRELTEAEKKNAKKDEVYGIVDGHTRYQAFRLLNSKAKTLYKKIAAEVVKYVDKDGADINTVDVVKSHVEEDKAFEANTNVEMTAIQWGRKLSNYLINDGWTFDKIGAKYNKSKVAVRKNIINYGLSIGQKLVLDKKSEGGTGKWHFEKITKDEIETLNEKAEKEINEFSQKTYEEVTKQIAKITSDDMGTKYQAIVNAQKNLETLRKRLAKTDKIQEYITEQKKINAENLVKINAEKRAKKAQAKEAEKAKTSKVKAEKETK